MHMDAYYTYCCVVQVKSLLVSNNALHFPMIDSELQPPSGIVVSDVESTSVRVSWQAVEDADRYTVTLSRTMGDDQLGLCREDSHTVSVDTSSLSVVVGQTDDDMLRAYTTYSITVAAESDELGNSQHSQPDIVTTKQEGNLLKYISCVMISAFSVQVQKCLLVMSGPWL